MTPPNTQVTLERLRAIFKKTPTPVLWEQLYGVLVDTREHPELHTQVRKFALARLADWAVPYDEPDAVWSYWRSATMQQLHSEDPWALWFDLASAWDPHTLSWSPGCSPEQLRDAEARLGISLPAHLRAWYERFGFPEPVSTPSAPHAATDKDSPLPHLQALQYDSQHNLLSLGSFDVLAPLLRPTPNEPPGRFTFCIELSDSSNPDPSVGLYDPQTLDHRTPHAPSFTDFLLLTSVIVWSTGAIYSILNEEVRILPNTDLHRMPSTPEITLPGVFPDNAYFFTAPNLIALLLGFTEPITEYTYNPVYAADRSEHDGYLWDGPLSDYFQIP